MKVTQKIKARLEKSKKLDTSKSDIPSIINQPTPAIDNNPKSKSKSKPKFKFGKSKDKPKEKVSPISTPTMESSLSTNKNNRHLICDDAFANRLVLKKYLMLYGCEVDEAENGLGAIEKVNTNGTYNVIWMDIKMPKMDGFTCTENLVSKMKYSGPIIGLTGYVDEETVKKCYAMGMTHVLSKPFDKSMIKNYCEQYQGLPVPVRHMDSLEDHTEYASTGKPGERSVHIFTPAPPFVSETSPTSPSEPTEI